MNVTIDEALDQGGAGRFQRKLLGIFGLVWAADAMQVIAIGFAAPSLAATFGLSVPQALQAGTLFFLGMFIGASLFGRIADRVGRRNVLLLTVTCDAIFGLWSVFANDFTLLLGLRLLTGMAVGGTLPVDYAMMAEFLPARNRGRWLVWLEGFWAIGTIIIALTVWIATSMGSLEPWRWIFLIAALPAMIGIGLRFWVPESPMYLLRKGREAEARDVVNRILTVNGARPLAEDVRLVLPAVSQPKGGIMGEDLRRRTISILAVWFLVSLSYYGVFVWLPSELVKNGFGFVRGYGFLVLLALAQVPGYALAAHGVERWGRKPTLILFLILSAGGCLLFTLAPSDIVVAFSLLLMSFALLGTWGALYAYTPELYPTSLRGTGMGAAGAVARLGGLLAPSLMGYVVAQGFGVAIGVFAAFLVMGAIAALMIETETRNATIA
ncbi:MFS transporter [Paracoccus sulfuroxidans]|uniref:Putative MFS transporter n=1 Tax=Paracoccus sulfuroxidans TaxID=384678 RepID=A0A562NUT2_9RHOB|nr:MFS transporter [Paracoccus sulfuroxidans]TWI35952.1 putative MFS transporter [Paracoccus sulfuroxidans]